MTDAKGSGTGHGLSKRARAGGWGLSPSSSNVWPFKCRSPPARHTTLAVAAINQAHRAVPGLAESRASGSAKVHVPSNYTSSGMSRQCANRALRNPVQPQGRSFDHQSLRGPRSVASASRSSRSAQLNPSLALRGRRMSTAARQIHLRASRQSCKTARRQSQIQYIRLTGFHAHRRSGVMYQPGTRHAAKISRRPARVASKTGPGC